MNLAILGADLDILEFARAVRASGEHEIVLICDDSEDAGYGKALHDLAPWARTVEAWEALIDTEFVQAVLVARGLNEDLREEQLRKFVQSGVPILASHPVCSSMLIYYELDMVRRDTKSIVMAYLPQRTHPAVIAAAAMIQGQSAIGSVEQMVMERRMAQRTKRAVLEQFARDVDVIRALCGEITRLGAMGAAAGEAAYPSLGVQMNGAGGLLARWSVAPAESGAGGRLVLLGSAGRATIEMSAGGQPWTMEVLAGDAAERQVFDDWNPAAIALAQLDKAVAGQPQPDNSLDNWLNAARSVELAETIPRSLQKGRTIDLVYDDYTEQGTFKGLMASAGCGLLLIGLALMFVAAAGDQLGIPHVGVWRYILLGLLGLFLLMQLLMLVFPKRSRGDEPPDNMGEV